MGEKVRDLGHTALLSPPLDSGAQQRRNAVSHGRSQPLFGRCWQAAVLTGVHQGLPLVAPLCELLGVLPLHAGPLLEARHDVITRLEGILRPLDRPLVVPRL